MKAYKGFNKDMTCRDFQYEEGGTYEEPNATLCKSGFHACKAPLDTFKYYGPARSTYHEVELEDVGQDRHDDDSKVVAKKITIGGKLDIAGLCKAQFEYVKSQTTFEHTDPKLATAGDSGTATAGNYGAATAGDSGAATAGYYGAATSRGKAAVGGNGIACVRGNGVQVKGGMGAILVIGVENDSNYDLKDWKAFVVDGKDVLPDTWYALQDGALVAVE